MNRRELLSGIASVAAACGVTGTVSAIEAEPQPLLLVLSVPGRLSCEASENFRRVWNKRFGDKGLPELVILNGGATLEAVLDPRENS